MVEKLYYPRGVVWFSLLTALDIALVRRESIKNRRSSATLRLFLVVRQGELSLTFKGADSKVCHFFVCIESSGIKFVPLKLRSSRAASNWPLRATCTKTEPPTWQAAAIWTLLLFWLTVARSGQLDAALDERSFSGVDSFLARYLATDISIALPFDIIDFISV